MEKIRAGRRRGAGRFACQGGRIGLLGCVHGRLPLVGVGLALTGMGPRSPADPESARGLVQALHADYQPVKELLAYQVHLLTIPFRCGADSNQLLPYLKGPAPRGMQAREVPTRSRLIPPFGTMPNITVGSGCRHTLPRHRRHPERNGGAHEEAAPRGFVRLGAFGQSTNQPDRGSRTTGDNRASRDQEITRRLRSPNYPLDRQA